jgi:hypothetical protein
MPFPSIAPASRNYKPGDWPVKTYSALSGAEVRIRYGNRRTGAELSLGYSNITDAQAQQFLTHYTETEGTFRTFSLPSSVTTGWRGTAIAFSPGSSGAAYRYAGPPEITSVRPGVSNVSVDLLGVV